MATAPALEKLPKRLLRKAMPVVMLTLWLASVFGSAGTLRWPRGWITIAAFLVSVTILVLLVRHYDPALLAERRKFRFKDAKRFDRIVLRIMQVLMVAEWWIAGLDAVRFRWTEIPFAAVYPGIFMMLGAFALITWVLAVNPHAEGVVRIQNDRGHRVISSGPYRFVRHPMYFGFLFLFPAIAIVLGSVWALAPAAAIGVLLVIRTVLEDRTLRRELPGYEEYAASARYRLIPGVW